MPKRPSDTAVQETASKEDYHHHPMTQTTINKSGDGLTSSRLKLRIKRFHAVARWSWNVNDEVCGICQTAFEGTSPNVKYPGEVRSSIIKAANNVVVHLILSFVCYLRIVQLFLASAGTRSIYNASRSGCQQVLAAISNNLVPFVVKIGSLGKILLTEIRIILRKNETFLTDPFWMEGVSVICRFCLEACVERIATIISKAIINVYDKNVTITFCSRGANLPTFEAPRHLAIS